MFSMMRRYLIALLRVLCATAFFVAILWAANFPYSADAPLSSAEVAAARNYYTQIYLKPIDDRAAETDYDRKYRKRLNGQPRVRESWSGSKNLWIALT